MAFPETKRVGGRWGHWLLPLVLAGASAFAGDTDGEAPSRLPETSSIPQILDSIRQLESNKDAKCYATASRLEDFIYGTPLSPEARFRKADLQKALILDLWREASARAAAAGEDRVGPSHVQPLLDAALRVEVAGDGSTRVDLGKRTVVLSARDVEHYSSVAYALRALLAVQQDLLLGGGEELLPADPGAIDAMRQFLDLYTLTALSLADEAARLADRDVLSVDGLVAAWDRVGAAGSRPVGSGGIPAATGGDGSLAVLRAITEAKLASYAAYNRLQDDPVTLFRANTQHFFLRYALPPTMEEVEDMERRLDTHLARFVGDLLLESQRQARDGGRSIIRAEDAHAALHKLTPHRMNRFEDATFFPRLPHSERVTLEAYDLDSFRDLGLHWEAIRWVLENERVAGLTLEPDPFAAELIAEGVAQYGVLVLRLAGSAARAAELPGVPPKFIDDAAARVVERTAANARAPEPDTGGGALVSAGGAAAAPPGKYFTDVTDRVGAGFVHRSSDWLSRFRRDMVLTPPTFSGGGIASEDVNDDGIPDLLLVGGGGNALLLGDGRGGFRDVTERAGIVVLDDEGHPAEARQPLIADLDNDGHQDLLITYVNENHRVYRGLGGGRFEDVTDRAGLGGAGLIGGPATTFDYDRDGLLDVYIAYFGDYLAGAFPKVARHNDNAQPNKMFRNLGGLRFQEVDAGSDAADTGWTQALSHTDFDLDGWQDLIVANDYGRNSFLRNLGNGRFQNIAAELGVDEPAHSMNVGLADLNWDNYPDVYISNIVAMTKDDRYVLPNENTVRHFDPRAMARMRVVESNVLHVSKFRNGKLSYVTSGAITRGANSTGWAWDADFFDFDNDGDDDLYCVNGANDYFIFAETRYLLKDGEVTPLPYNYSRESNVFFVNQGDELRNESERSGADFVGTSRSTAYLDFDGDGDLDVVVNNFHGPATFLRNNSEARGNHWLKVRLQGDPSRGSNRDAIGARMLLRTPEGGRVWREVHGGTGYLSMDPREQHFGLGASRQADLWIRWPDGEEQILRALPANTSHLVVQGEEPGG